MTAPDLTPEAIAAVAAHTIVVGPLSECVVVIIQPRLEPWPRKIVRMGRFAAFFYVRWSSIGISIEVLRGGLAIGFGPALFGAVHIDRQLGLAVRAILSGDAK